MQGNSLIKTFAILFGLVSIYQLSFTFISSTLENKAKNAAIEKISENEISFSEKRAREEVRFLDSIGDLPVLMYSLNLSLPSSQNHNLPDQNYQRLHLRN